MLQSPYPVDQSWRRKQVVGVMLDRLVGFWWSIFMLLGFGKNAGLVFFVLFSSTSIVVSRSSCGHTIGGREVEGREFDDLLVADSDSEISLRWRSLFGTTKNTSVNSSPSLSPGLASLYLMFLLKYHFYHSVPLETMLHMQIMRCVPHALTTLQKSTNPSASFEFPTTQSTCTPNSSA